MRKTNYYLTPEGVEKFKNELQDLQENIVPEVRKELQEAQEDEADPTENPAYRDALDEKRQVEQRLTEVQTILNNYQLIENGDSDKVRLGSTVVVEVDGEKDKFQIVGPLEADPVEGKISNESPVGEALLGSKPGEKVEAGGSIVRAKYKILSIS